MATFKGSYGFFLGVFEPLQRRADVCVCLHLERIVVFQAGGDAQESITSISPPKRYFRSGKERLFTPRRNTDIAIGQE